MNHSKNKHYFVSAFFKVLTILYLLFVLVYQLSSPTFTYFSDEYTYHGILSTIELFEPTLDDKVPKQSDQANQSVMPEKDYDSSREELDDNGGSEMSDLEAEENVKSKAAVLKEENVNQ